jgi:acetoin utilization protein AcuB
MATPVSHYMTAQPLTIGRRASLAKARGVMREHGIRHLPVVDAGRLVGILSQGDLHLIETIADFPLEAIEVDDAMTAQPYIVAGDTPVDELVGAMVKHKYGCALIGIENGAVEGIFTKTDALRMLAELLRAAPSAPQECADSSH